MIGQVEPLRTAEGPSKLDEAKETIQTAADTVKVTTQRLGEAIDAGRRPGALDRLANWAREAPLHTVAVAFLVGVVHGRRR